MLGDAPMLNYTVNTMRYKDTPPNRAISELGSVCLARLGSIGPSSSSHIGRASVPRIATARTGPIAVQGSNIMTIEN